MTQTVGDLRGLRYSADDLIVGGGTVTFGDAKTQPRPDPMQLEQCENGWVVRFLHTGEVYVFNSDELLLDFIKMFVDDKGEDK